LSEKKVSIVDPLAQPNWDDLLIPFEHATFFHTTSWARVIHDTYGYKALYFTVRRDEKIIGLIPVMEVKSRLTGTRGVSIPFTDICHPLVESPEILRVLVDSVLAYGKDNRWKYVEIRGTTGCHESFTSFTPFYVHTLNLRRGEEVLLKSFRGSTRRNIRKAEKAEVKVSFANSLSAMEAFYCLHCETRRRHGLPPQPWLFFERLHEHVISQGRGFVALASHKESEIAAAVYLLWKNGAIYKFGASKRNHTHLRTNYLVMWEAIRRLVRNGFTNLHLGRTDCDDSGLLQFKRGWRADERVLRYHLINLNGEAMCLEKSPFRVLSPIVKMMPLSALRVMGKLLYRHVG
jgi:hypothetical protein